VLHLRSLIFNVLFYVNLAAWVLLGSFMLLTPRKWAVRSLQAWSVSSLWLLKVICGISLELRGRQHIPDGPLLVAAKHQSAWDTFGLLPIFDYPTFVMKRELFWIPVHGWFSMKFGMIGIDRSGGVKALRKLTKDGKEAIAAGRQIIIFPEGTRREPGAEPDYKPGAAALYTGLGVTCLPVALNSGVVWPRRRFLRYPGTVVVEFLEPIPPGLDRKAFSATLEERIETASTELICPAHVQSGI
jgi:1-acyl-sn-glycerol-3-phosphate acyltransferase